MPRLKCPSRFAAEDSDVLLLRKALGRGPFVALQKAFGGRRIWIPKSGTRPSCLTCCQRDKCIKDWRKQHRPVADIARHLGVSPKTVYRVLERDA